MYKFLSMFFGFGIFGAVVSTWVAPRVISMLVTPPVSFSTNCEPAASWATSKLITAQISGLAIGMIIACIWMISRTLSNRKKDEKSQQAVK
jgi:uncharacterized BrkB/YihY/UPF0761 family membrane protein